MWNRFWNWYEKQLMGSLAFLLMVHVVQIPHMIWAADVYMELGMISRIHPILDFLLYGVDLVELLSLTQIIMLIYAHGIRHKLK
tara:strand:+ start:433 stop:684 length:252 start_codon:yes stop_codon:yes gene_type:complete